MDQDGSKDPTSGDASRYKIERKATSKDDIVNPPEVEAGIIPPLGSSLLLCGKSGSGKSTLLASLINDDNGRFYTGRFDKMFLFSPTAEGDDVQGQYGIDPKYVFTDLEDAPELLTLIHDSQRSKLKETTSDKAPQYAIIFDDVIGDLRFMNSKPFTQCFYQTRHVNCTTFICTQHFKRVPRICRMQANFICFFRGGQSEVELIAEEFAPPGVTKREFMQIIDNTLREPFAFFTINMKVPWEDRFRRNLYPIIPIMNSYDVKEIDCLKEKSTKDSQEEQSSNLAQHGISNSCGEQKTTGTGSQSFQSIAGRPGR